MGISFRLPRWLRAATIVSIFPFVLSGAAADAEREVLSSYLWTPASDSEIAAVADQFEIVHRHGSDFEILVPIERTKEFLGLAPAARLVEEDIHATLRAIEKINPEYLAGYHSFDDVQRILAEIASTRPDIAKLETYGSSQGGRPLLALKLSDNVDEDEDEPELLLTSATHGDEIITVEVLLSLLQELLDGYGKDSRLTNMVDGSELYFILAVNPDGYASRQRYSNGVDPNRDYPWPEQPNRSPNACIKGVMDFFHSRNFAGSIDLHAYGQMIMYPWAWTSQSPDQADLTKFSELGRIMGQGNRYEVGQISRVIYVAKGSSADYYYWKTGSLSYGVELATSKAPPASSIPSVVNEAREMTWKFIEYFL